MPSASRGIRYIRAPQTILPLKLNQAGVIPIIFAVSFVLMPQLIGNFLRYVKNPAVAGIATFLANAFNPSGFFYNFFYFILVVAFTFFIRLSFLIRKKSLMKYKRMEGSYQGSDQVLPQSNFLEKIVYKITSVGALFLGIIAVLPALVSKLTGMNELVIGERAF